MHDGGSKLGFGSKNEDRRTSRENINIDSEINEETELKMMPRKNKEKEELSNTYIPIARSASRRGVSNAKHPEGCLSIFRALP